jgi:serine/threonine-protein kinase
VAGALRLVVKPWADVTVDGRAIGQTPLADIPLSAGAHAVVLSHPAYRPFPRKVVVRGGEVVRLSVDLQTEGIRLR